MISGPRLQIWRGPTDNDGIKGWTDETWRPLNKWRAQGLDKLAVKTVSAKARRNKDGSVTFLFEHLGACAASDRAVRHRHSPHPAPSVHVQTAASGQFGGRGDKRSGVVIDSIAIIEVVGLSSGGQLKMGALSRTALKSWNAGVYCT